MKLAIVVLSLFINFSFSQPPNPPDPDVYWFTQKFDHTTNDQRTFQQRYLVYDKYWKEQNSKQQAIFFCPGGEADVFGGYEHNGFMFELGKQIGAILLFPEHRFYGKSLPLGPVDSYKPENIVMLSIEQSITDYIVIIDHFKTVWNISDNVPLIAFGGSYPGDLTTYMRVAFPDIVDAGLASSAPLNYRAGKVEGGAFFQVATVDFGLNNPECPDLVRQAFNEIIELAQTPAGRTSLSNRLGLCSVIDEGAASLRLLALWIENAFATLGMENYPYPLDGLPKFPMLAACDMMSKSSKDLIDALGQTVGVVYNATGTNLVCFNITNEYYPCADITGCGGGVGDPDAMSWDYQSCTEVVSNVDTNNVTDMFPPAPYNFRELVAYCQKTWNATPDPLKIPTHYNYSTTTRLIFSNGKLDPWYPGGVLPDECPENKDMHCFLIEEAAHHLDLRGTDPVNDPPAVTKARQIEAAIILKWVVEIYQEKSKIFNLA